MYRFRSFLVFSCLAALLAMAPASASTVLTYSFMSDVIDADDDTHSESDHEFCAYCGYRIYAVISVLQEDLNETGETFFEFRGASTSSGGSGTGPLSGNPFHWLDLGILSEDGHVHSHRSLLLRPYLQSRAAATFGPDGSLILASLYAMEALPDIGVGMNTGHYSYVGEAIPSGSWQQGLHPLLAGVEVPLAPAPLPAGGLLLIAALAGLAVMRQRVTK